MSFGFPVFGIHLLNFSNLSIFAAAASNVCRLGFLALPLGFSSFAIWVSKCRRPDVKLSQFGFPTVAVNVFVFFTNRFGELEHRPNPQNHDNDKGGRRKDIILRIAFSNLLQFPSAMNILQKYDMEIIVFHDYMMC